MTNRLPYLILIVAYMLAEFVGSLPSGALPLALSKDHIPLGDIALVMGTGSLATLAFSIPVGALLDRIGRIAVLRVSILVFMCTTIGLAFTHGAVVTAFILALRGLAGMAVFSSMLAYGIGVVPPSRAVSSIGMIGNAGNVGTAIAPTLSVWLWLHGVGREQFLYASAFCVICMVLFLFLPQERAALTVRRRRTIVMRSVWFPAMSILFAIGLQGGVNGSLAILTFTSRGIANGALLFTALAVTTLIFRYPSGRLVDKRGGPLLTVPTLVAQISGSLVASHAHTALGVIFAGVLFGIALSFTLPVGTDLLFSRSTNRTRGIAMGAYSFSMTLGGATGAVLAWVVVKLGFNYTLASEICALCAAAVIPWVLFTYRATFRVSLGHMLQFFNPA